MILSLSDVVTSDRFSWASVLCTSLQMWHCSVVPLIIVARLKSISKFKKIRLMVLFSIGFVSMIGGVTRMIHVVKIDKDLDRTWIYNKYNTWALVDLTFGITAASLPVFNSFIFPSKWPKANHLPHLSPFKAKHSNGVSRRLPSAEDMQWAPTYGRHMSQKYYNASFLPPDGEQYQGKGPDDMSLEFHNEEILAPRVEEKGELEKGELEKGELEKGELEKGELEKGHSPWDQSEETVEISKHTPSWREGLRKEPSFGHSESQASTNV